MRTLLPILLSFSAAICYAAEYEFHFWPGLNSGKDSRIISITDGPCGAVASARVSSMPRHSKTTPLVPERVFELDASSQIVRSWNIPVDSFPIAVEGKDLHFSFFDAAYIVTPEGTLNKSTYSGKLKEPTAATCQPPKAFDGSGYASCWLFEDVRSGRKRILAFEGVCT